MLLCLPVPRDGHCAGCALRHRAARSPHSRQSAQDILHAEIPDLEEEAVHLMVTPCTQATDPLACRHPVPHPRAEGQGSYLFVALDVPWPVGNT